MPENSPAKARALRIPLGSHTSDRLAIYRNLMTMVAVLACVAWMLTGIRSPKMAAERYSPGPLSPAHVNLGCNNCHADSGPMREGTFLSEWSEKPAENVPWHRKSDTMCQSCHPVLTNSGELATRLSSHTKAHISQPIPIAVHTDNQRVESVASCAHCHVEHKGLENQLSQVTDSNCINCHHNLAEFRGLEESAIANRITRFEVDHPPFTALKTDRGTLKFNHDLHLAVGIVGEDENSKLIKTIGDYPEHGGRLDGYTTTDGTIALNCGFCHQPTNGMAAEPDSLVALSSGSSAVGRFMSMPTYERDCQVCHSTDFVPHQDFDFERKLRIEHGASPAKISEALEDYFSLAALAPPNINDQFSKETIDTLEELPTRLWNIDIPETKLNSDIDRPIELAIGTAMDSIRINCLKCHIESEQDTGSGIPEIRTIPNLPGRFDNPTVFETSWFEKGRFDHSAHRDVACAKCHEMNEGKNGLIRQKIDVSLDKPMIKDRDSCVECHQSPELVLAPSRTGPTNCSACHTYHDGGNRHDNKSADVSPQIYSTQNVSFVQTAKVQPVNNTQTSEPNRLSIAGCVSCHGSPSFLDADKPQERWQSAYQIWASRDPHSQAYLTLWNDQSKKMVAAVARFSSGRQPISTSSVDDELHQSIINERCISCHSTVTAKKSNEMIRQRNDGRALNGLSLSHGVECHSCHSADDLDDQNGNSWIERHVKQAWSIGHDDRSSSGLNNLAALDVRAETCANCHVGSENGDVNHDLIAAGHPRLVFEYSSLLSRLPKHWNETQNHNFHVECWSVGQIELARASLALLASRAKGSLDGDHPWPEFAEYNCHNCHHDLHGNRYYPNQSKKVGKLAWGGWAFPVAEDQQPLSDQISNLRLEMQKPNPDAAAVLRHSSPVSVVYRDNHATEQLAAYLKRQPDFTSDGLFAWYLAVHSCLRDATGNSPQHRDLRMHMAEFRKILEIPFADRDDNRTINTAELLVLIDQIRQLVLPILERPRDSGKPQP